MALGQPGALVVDHEGRLIGVMNLVAEGQIQGVSAINNPGQAAAPWGRLPTSKHCDASAARSLGDRRHGHAGVATGALVRTALSSAAPASTGATLMAKNAHVPPS